MSFFPFLFILHVGSKTPSPGEIYGSRRYVLIREHHLFVFSSQLFRLGSFSIHFFSFSHLFINIFLFINPKNYITTLNQGIPISERSLEALVWFISSPRSFSSFHRSFSLSKSKKYQKIASHFNLLTFLPMDSTLTCHCSNLKIRFEELSINFI